MTKFLLMLLFFRISSPEKHSFMIFCAGFSGIPNFPDFISAAEVDGLETGRCDSNKTMTIKHEWVKTLMQTDPDQMLQYETQCFEIQPYNFKFIIKNLMQSSGQSEGVHTFQSITGCEWDDETGQVDSFIRCAYNGEDFISFDVKRLTWIALRPGAVATGISWNTGQDYLKFYEHFLTKLIPEWLKKYVDAGRNSLLRTVLPSVSLLQKSPSSPVSCHATGFFPDRAVMFWRRDGEELQEDVDPGEILPNHDGSFQMSVDLNISSVTPEDWGRYECVFQLSGVEEDQVYKLNKDKIRTNHNDPTVPVSVSVVLLLLLLLVAAVVGSVFYRLRKAAKTRTEKDPDSTSMNTPSCSQPDQDHHNQEEEALNTETLS